jgi:hypothetical protein
MCSTVQSRILVGIVQIITLLISPAAFAGRSSPLPLLKQFSDGYGMVAAEVVSITPVGHEEPLQRSFEFVFKVKQIIAQPVVGGPFSFTPGDSLSLPLTVGYGSTIEDSPKAGDLYFLTIKRSGAGSFEHADGSGAAHQMKPFTKSEAAFYDRIRSLAAIPKAEQLDRWLAVEQDNTVPDAVRREVLCGIEIPEPWEDKDFPPQNLRKIHVSLQRVWNDPGDTHSYWHANSLDFMLTKCDRTFENSVVRLDGWMRQLFARTPENLKNDNDRDNFAQQQLYRLMDTYPKELGNRLIAEMNNRQWPAEFRLSIAGALLGQILHSEHSQPEWEPALQKLYAELLADSTPWVVRLVTAHISRGHVDNNLHKPRFRADADVVRALRNAYSRMKEIVSHSDGDPNAAVAVHDIEVFLKERTNEDANH